jgi:hypothetical protein
MANVINTQVLLLQGNLPHYPLPPRLYSLRKNLSSEFLIKSNIKIDRPDSVTLIDLLRTSTDFHEILYYYHSTEVIPSSFHSVPCHYSSSEFVAGSITNAI